MFVTLKPLLIHEFPARVCCGDFLWVSVLSGVVRSRSVWLLHVFVYCISLCDFLISAVWRKLTKGVHQVWLGKTRRENFAMLKQALGNLCMCRSRTFEWFGRFKNERTSTVHNDRSGRPSTATSSNVEQVQAAITQDRRRKIHDICANVGLPYGSCQQILTEELNMHRIAAKLVPTADPGSETVE